MQTIRETFAENNELSVFPENPIIHATSKEVQIFLTKPATKQLIDLLPIPHQPIGPSCRHTPHLQKNTRERNSSGHHGSSFKSALEKIVLAKAKELSKAEISLTNKVDPSIVGGFILRIGDLQYNASVSINWSI